MILNTVPTVHTRIECRLGSFSLFSPATEEFAQFSTSFLSASNSISICDANGDYEGFEGFGLY